MEDKNSIKLDLLARQDDALQSSITDMMTVGTRVVAVVSALIVGGLALAIREQAEEILMLLPVLLFALAFYYLNLHTAIREMGAYRRFVQEEINRLVGEEIYLWEIKLVPARHRNAANLFMSAILVLILMASVVLAVWISSSYSNPWAFRLVVIANFCLIGGFIFAGLDMMSSFDRAYRRVKLD